MSTSEIIEAAIRADAAPELMPAAIADLRALAGRAFSEPGSPAYGEYQRLLYALHERDEPATDAARRYLAAHAYRVEEALIPRVRLEAALSDEELSDRIRQSLAKSRSVHPVVRHCVFGTPSVADMKVFFVYQWFRTYKLYQDATDLALTLMGDIEEGAMMYRYLFEETGEADPRGAHALLLQDTCRYFGVPSEFSLRSDCLEEIAYLNNRRRSFRSADPEWAYAIFYVTELVVSAVHKNFFETLRRLGVPEAQCEYYRVHIELVPPRAKREWAIFWRRLQHKESQELFLTSLAHHLRVESTYFDEIWRHVQAGPDA